MDDEFPMADEELSEPLSKPSDPPHKPPAGASGCLGSLVLAAVVLAQAL